ncbi:MAG: helicase HerA domain-containing protein [Ktedonobacteraceae bacterium]
MQTLKGLLQKIYLSHTVFSYLVLVKAPSLTIGHSGRWPFSFPVTLTGRELTKHKHIMGTSGRGKSKFLALCATDLILQGVPCAIIDPHSDLAHDLLRLLKERGFYNTPDAFERVLYVDFSNVSRFIPFNVLQQSQFDTYTIARNIVQAAKRAWPELGITFDNLMFASAFVLSQNGLTLTETMPLLNRKDFRERLLQNVTDFQIVSYFHDEVDTWSKNALDDNMGSTKRRMFELCTMPPLRYSLGQRQNVLDFNTFLQRGISVIYNLGGLDESTKGILGCLLSVGHEQATLSRSKVREMDRLPYHIFIDEFQMFLDRSEKAFMTFLSEARKYNVTQWLAHQTLSQTSERFQGALQNAQPIAFGLGRSDSLIASQIFARYDPYRIKHMIPDDEQAQRTHPQFFALQEQFEDMARSIEDLPVQWAYIKLEKKRFLRRSSTETETMRFRTPHIPPHKTTWEELQELEKHYAQTLLRSRSEIEQEVGAIVSNSSAQDEDGHIGTQEGMAIGRFEE